MQTGAATVPNVGQLLTPRAAGAIIGIPASTLYRMIARGQIPAYTVGQTGRRVIISEILAAMRRPVIVAGHGDAR